ncbi:MAG: hypothetical protein D6705_14095 [Deltaproteobacteria bacterium]|nr:MAG: hypothetical protein D6705_14095 [Deltaproteobacteria bacterium]
MVGAVSVVEAVVVGAAVVVMGIAGMVPVEPPLPEEPIPVEPLPDEPLPDEPDPVVSIPVLLPVALSVADAGPAPVDELDAPDEALDEPVSVPDPDPEAEPDVDASSPHETAVTQAKRAAGKKAAVRRISPLYRPCGRRVKRAGSYVRDGPSRGCDRPCGTRAGRGFLSLVLHQHTAVRGRRRSSPCPRHPATTQTVRRCPRNERGGRSACGCRRGHPPRSLGLGGTASTWPARYMPSWPGFGAIS